MLNSVNINYYCHNNCYLLTGGYDLDTVPVRDLSPRNGTPDSGWDDDDEELDLGLGKVLLCEHVMHSIWFLTPFFAGVLYIKFTKIIIACLIQNSGMGKALGT